MDYDLFQSDDDDDLLTAFNEATQRCHSQQGHQQQSVLEHHGEDDDDRMFMDIIPEFNCNGRDTLKTKQFPNESFIRNGYGQPNLPRLNIENLNFDFNCNQLQQVVAVRNYLQGEACKNIQKLFAAVNGQQQLQGATSSTRLSLGSSWFKIRQQVTHFYHLMIVLYQDTDDNDDDDADADDEDTLSRHWLEDVRQLLNQQLDAEKWKTLYFAENSKGNECQAPSYHLYHGILEWRLMDIILLSQGDRNREQFVRQMERNLDDLILCSWYNYRNKHRPELIHSSPFICRCTKELWLLIKQRLIVKNMDFWTHFHQAMQRLKITQSQGHSQSESINHNLAYHEFYAWLRLGLARLASDHDAGDDNDGSLSGDYQCSMLLRQFLASSPDEQQRRVYLCLLAPLLEQAKDATAALPDILGQLWECLHRLLNSNFHVQQLEQLPLTQASGLAYLERYTKLLNQRQLDDLNLSSFSMYVWLLGRTMRSHPSQGQKLLGRIFSKFSAAKLLALNESGIHHIIELFLCILLSHASFADVATKLREMLLCLVLEKLPPGRRFLAAKGHMAVLLLHARKHHNMEDYIVKLLSQLNAIRNDVEIGGIYANTLESIFELADDFSLGEQLLVGPWLTIYAEKCGQASQDRIWELLHMLIGRLNDLRGGAVAMKDALQQHILPLLKMQYVNNAQSHKLTQLLADFIGLEKDQERDNLIAGLFQGPEPANMSASAQLLLYILQAEGKNPTNSIMIQVWVKSLVLLTAQHEVVVALTQHISQLEEFRQLQLEPASLQASREPLCSFFRALGQRVQHQEESEGLHMRMQYSHKLHAYVYHFEQWLPPDRLRSELGSRFFSFLAIVIYNCPTLSYVRSKPSCFFHLAMVRFLLTTQLQAGTPPEPRLPQIVHKIFPVLLQGIGRLSYTSDTYLGKTLEQLIHHWTPHFSFTTNVKLVARPYSILLQADNDGELAQYVLNQLTSQFLAVQRRKAGTHAGLIITLLQQLMEGLNVEQERELLTLLRAIHSPLLEHIMFVDELEHSRGQVLAIYRILVSLPVFKSSTKAKEICSSVVCSLAKKHLAHCTYFYFQMLIKLAEQAPELVRPLLPFVKQEAEMVELKRGAGEDVGIRKCLQRLQQVFP
ncbi:protein MMS22-like [Drosophila willistoni]|uniref:protein MMS22-like n=1 Tax=Drosophila willistoni TaxID=7260 RepID=UPI00017D9D06|nr:protein MMS22-like [Drosophila willistoni]